MYRGKVEKMKIVALAKKGAEFMYRATTAHQVPARRAQEIADDLNIVEYQTTPGLVWHVFDVDQYDAAFDFAAEKSFLYRNGKLIEKAPRRAW